MTRVKIENILGTFEFEGNDEAIKSQIENLVTILQKETNEKQVKNSVSKKVKEPAKQKSHILNQPQSIPGLLSVDDIQRLRKYYSEKNPSSHIETFALITLWLRDNKNLESISINEIWTTYKAINCRPPKNLLQVFRDGKSKKNFFHQSGDTGFYSITSIGETYIEYDLPQKGEKNERN